MCDLLSFLSLFPMSVHYRCLCLHWLNSFMSVMQLFSDIHAKVFALHDGFCFVPNRNVLHLFYPFVCFFLFFGAPNYVLIFLAWTMNLSTVFTKIYVECKWNSFCLSDCLSLSAHIVFIILFSLCQWFVVVCPGVQYLELIVVKLTVYFISDHFYTATVSARFGNYQWSIS